MSQRRGIYAASNCGAIAGAGAGAGASNAASPPLPTSLVNGDATPHRNHLHDSPHLEKESRGAIAGVGASHAAFPRPPILLMKCDATPRSKYLYDLPHLDKEIVYGWYAEALVKSLNLLKVDSHPEVQQQVDSHPEDTTGANGPPLLEYHIILSRLFTSAVSVPRMQKYPEVLCYILDCLSNIWTQSEWKANLINAFCDCRFRTSFLNVFVFFEKELELCLKGNSSEINQESSISYATLTNLLRLILPTFLTLLQYMQALWTKAVASNIPDVLEGAKSMVFSEGPGETLKVQNIDKEEQEQNAIRNWLETTRQIGYNVIGMCAQLEGVFDLILDSSAVCGSLMKDISSMGFHHLTLLIQSTIIPLVKNCPKECWEEWVVELLYPVFDYFHNTLYESWCDFLHEGLVQVPDTIVYVFASEDKADGKTVGGLPHCSQSKKNIEKDLLIQLTHAASDLLAVIASPELNGGLGLTTCTQLDYICSSSLVGYVLHHDGLRLLVLSLIYYIFGAWKDDKAIITSVPFCCQIVQIAKATRHEELISFVKDDMISHVIWCLTLESSLNSTILTDLCRDAYKCVQNQDLVCGGKYNGSSEESTEETAEKKVEEIFQSWLSRQIFDVRCRNTPFDNQDEFVPTWGDEDEFRAYIPAYIDMLHQVDEMDDCLKWGYCSPRAFFKKLKPDFASRYDIDSEFHDYVSTMSAIFSRKISVKRWQSQNDQMYKFFCELISLKPYIQQHSSYDESVLELVKNLEVCPGLVEFLRVSALEKFCAILSLWEPQFHPMIREGHKEVLREIVLHLTRVETLTFLQPLQPDLSDFPVHLRRYAMNYIEDENKKYHMAKEQARLHEKFDELVASSALDHYICKVSSSMDDALEAVLNDDRVHSQFSVLDHDLIKLSIKRRAKLLGRKEQLFSYSKHLRHVVGSDQLNIGLQSLMSELEAKDFFNITDDSIDWDKKCFSELVDKFNMQVFAGLHLPDYDVIRGIMDYRAMSAMKDASCSWDHVFEKVVGAPYRRWIQNTPMFWMDTRYYEHQYYDIIQQPLKKVACLSSWVWAYPHAYGGQLDILYYVDHC
ncbi:uncharacterized protein [Lolium perenne]|uniref:uncharacterized protein n=1 Tax=Lolium perenne TaxID=4522 RepID=UPI003A99E378